MQSDTETKFLFLEGEIWNQIVGAEELCLLDEILMFIVFFLFDLGRLLHLSDDVQL